MTRRRETQAAPFLSLFFPHLEEPTSWSRQNQGPLPLGRTGLMTQSQPFPFPEDRPFLLATSSPATHFPKPLCGHWCRSPGTGGSSDRETNNRQQGGHRAPKPQGCLGTDIRLGHGAHRNSCCPKGHMH